MELRWIERILIRDLETLKRELAAFPDEASLWATPPGIANSAGTLALHLAGNIRHFIGARLGGSGYVRDRDREFAARGLSRAAVLAEIDQAIGAVTATLTSGRLIDCSAEFPDRVGGTFKVVTGDWLIHLTTHCAFHLGQVGYLRRFLTGDGRSVGAVGIADLATAVRQPDR
jgi:hypothetical protein